MMRLSPGKFLVLLGVLGAGIGTAIYSSLRATARLRAQAEAALVSDSDAASLRRERDELLASQPPFEELERLQADNAGLDALRTDWERYRRELERQLRERRPRAVQPPPAANSTSAPEAWTNAGRHAPASALQTFVWAVRNGDVAELAKVITFDDDAPAEAERFFASLPEDLRREFGTPAALVTQVMAAKTRLDNLASAELKSEEPTGADEVTLRTEFRRGNGGSRNTTLRFRRDTGGWRLLVPAKVIEGYQALVLGVGPPVSPGTIR